MKITAGILIGPWVMWVQYDFDWIKFTSLYWGLMTRMLIDLAATIIIMQLNFVITTLGAIFQKRKHSFT